MDSLRLSTACRSATMGSDFGEVAALVTAYTDYLQALTGLCGRGVQLIRNFVGPCSVAYMLPAKEKEEVQKLWAIWEDINKSMQQSVWSVRTQSLQSLQDWLQQKSKEPELNDSSNFSQPDDLSKLITACLVAFKQLQYQFSAMCCHSFMELDMLKQEQNSPPELSTNSLSVLCMDEIDKERRDSGNVSDDLTISGAADPLFSQLQLGRRSSYELGNLHTASPPPPPVNMLSRRWSMPTDDLASGENKISPNFSGVLEKKRETLVSHEELDSVINLLSFNSGASVPPAANKSSNFGVKSNPLTGKLDNLSPPQPSRSSNVKYGAHPRHEQPLDSRSWSSKNSVPNNGLLTVVSMVSPDCQDLKQTRKNFEVHSNSVNSSSSGCSNSVNCKEYISPSQQKAKPNVGGNDSGVNNEGAFSIGLNLVGSDLMASVQQKSNEGNQAILPQIIVPEGNGKQARIHSSIGDTSWSSGDQSYKEVETPPPADFLPFSMNDSPGPSIWTPSQNDYTSSSGNYFFQVGPG